MRFLKNSDPKKLSIRNIWKLHKVIKYTHTNDVYFIDSILGIMRGLTEKEFSKSLHLLYKKAKWENGLVAANMFVAGIKSSKLLEFEDFMKALNHG